MKRLLLSALGALLILAVTGVAVLVEDVDNIPDSPSVQVIVAEQMIDVPVLCQYPTLPTGCESVAATMVLRYYGDGIAAEDFARDWLSCRDGFYRSGGRLYGPDPEKVFVGDPFIRASYGCFEGPIVQAVNGHSETCVAEAVVGRSLPSLCEEYIDRDHPLLVWVTMGMAEPREGSSWHLEDGSLFTWMAGEQCMVLVGYTSTHYLLNDPMTGEVAAYEKALVEACYIRLGRRAVHIYELKRGMLP